MDLSSVHEFNEYKIEIQFSGTLFRAGWVIGSLELLGSPTGLVRALGQGISDFVQMPYQGLNAGPRDFFQGMQQSYPNLAVDGWGCTSVPMQTPGSFVYFLHSFRNCFRP